MRMWAKMFMDSPPPKPMTQKDKILSLVSIIVDASIIGLLVYTLFVNSCQICYTTGYGANTFNRCSNVADVMADGVPSEIESLYKGEHPSIESVGIQVIEKNYNITELNP